VAAGELAGGAGPGSMRTMVEGATDNHDRAAGRTISSRQAVIIVCVTNGVTTGTHLAAS
jgi:predicted Rossmann-fold nucleotide-binding protein